VHPENVLRSVAVVVEAPDSTLIARMLDGDLSALGPLHERYFALVVRVAGYTGLDRHDAEDVAQDVFLKLPELAPRYDGHESARSWVLGVAWRMASDRRRSVSRRHRAMVERLTDDHCEPALNPEEQAVSNERCAALLSEIDRLPRRTRSAFVLVAVCELSCAEAASALDIPVATVWTRLHRARQKLLAWVGVDEVADGGRSTAGR